MYSRKSALFLLTAALLTSHVLCTILSESYARKELKKAADKGIISGSYINIFLCIMKYESNFDTARLHGPGNSSSFYHGVFQITSWGNVWCSRFRVTGFCNKNCNDFLDDNIQDDIACARRILDLQGFKYWKGWAKYCK